MPGTFGLDCRSICHCANDVKCNHINGSCTDSMCDTGWRGSDCSIGKILTFKYLILNYKVDQKAMVRNRYNRIPHPVLNTKRERDTHNQDGTKTKTAQAKSQGDSSFPTDGHKAILNKLNSKSKTNRTRTNIDN